MAPYDKPEHHAMPTAVSMGSVVYVCYIGLYEKDRSQQLYCLNRLYPIYYRESKHHHH